MANVLGELFGDIATAIRSKTGEEGTMKPAEFPAKIKSIGETVVYALEKISGFVFDSSTGSYTPGLVFPSAFSLGEGKTYRVNWEGADYECASFTFDMYGYTFVGIGNASSLGLQGNGEPFFIMQNITEDYTQIFATDDKDAHTVGIYTEATNEILLQEKTVTENGVVEPDEGYDGLGKVIVDVLASSGNEGVQIYKKYLSITGTYKNRINVDFGFKPDFLMIYPSSGVSTASIGVIKFGFSQRIKDKYNLSNNVHISTKSSAGISVTDSGHAIDCEANNTNVAVAPICGCDETGFTIGRVALYSGYVYILAMKLT